MKALDGSGMEKRIALVIGINKAVNFSLPPLKHAIADAVTMADVLQQYCNFQLLEPPLLDENASSDTVKKAVRKLARNRVDDDFLLLYFSGHGQAMPIEAGRQDVYLVTHDFDEIDVTEDEEAHISLRWLQEKLYIPTQAGRVLVILDCCYAGDIGRAAPDPYLEEIQKRINYYFGAPGTESGARPGGLRWALAATGHAATAHNAKAFEQGGHGVMTDLLLRALRGEVDDVLGHKGQVTLNSLYDYLYAKMPIKQKPSLSGDSAARDCILACHPTRAVELQSGRSFPEANVHPKNYIPFSRNPLFQPRPGEFERLGTMLWEPRTESKPPRLRLVGMVGLGGVGKTQLAIELAYRCLDKNRFPSGIFWMPATGKSFFEWQHQLAELAFNTGYLPLNDNVSGPENEIRRARHFSHYLAHHADALLILDHVEEPTLVLSVLPALAGGEIACSILYTSRVQATPPGVLVHSVEQLPEEGALRLLLETTRPLLLPEVLAGTHSAEADAARLVCQGVGYLPLALVHLRGLLMRDQSVTLVRLAEVLKQRGVLEVVKTQYSYAAPLFATFWLSWEKVLNEAAQRLFKLAAYFPEATPIPLWLLGLAAGLGERGDILEPLGRACLELRDLSLIEKLSGDQIRLHPLVRAFGQQLVAMNDEKGKSLLEEASERLTMEFVNLKNLEQRTQREGYWGCLEQVRAAHEYTKLLGTNHRKWIERIGRWLDRESYLLWDGKLWPEKIPGLFYQQLANRSVEEGYPLTSEKEPAQWLRQEGQVGAEDRALLRVLVGHNDTVMGVAFSLDGTKVLTGSADGTARLWETASGLPLATLEGHLDWVTSVAFSPDERLIIICDKYGRVFFWQASEPEIGCLLGAYVARYEVKAVHWQNSSQMMLADKGGPRGYPYIYRLKLEGI